MDSVESIRLGPLPPDSPYMKPFRLYYVQNGKEKNWGNFLQLIIDFYANFYKFDYYAIPDLIKAHDSVAIIVFNKTRNVLIAVKQFR